MNVIKTPAGTQDFDPEQTILRKYILTDIENVFEKFGGVPLETPIFERKEYLMKKYGDDTKLIYELLTPSLSKDDEDDNDTAGEVLCLRYDMTVPLSRYLVQNKVEKLKRYQIGKVY